MPHYEIRRKSDGAVVYPYEADVPFDVDAAGFPSAEYENVEVVVQPPPPPAPVPVYGGRRIVTKLEFLRLMTAQERITCREAAKVNPVLADFMSMLEMAEEISLDDHDTVVGLSMLEQAGLLGPGRAAEITLG